MFPFLFPIIPKQPELYVLNLLFEENRPIFKLMEEMQEYKKLGSILFRDWTKINKFPVTSAPEN